MAWFKLRSHNQVVSNIETVLWYLLISYYCVNVWICECLFQFIFACFLDFTAHSGGGLLQSSIVSAYIMYLTWSALLIEPDIVGKIICYSCIYKPTNCPNLIGNFAIFMFLLVFKAKQIDVCVDDNILNSTRNRTMRCK